MEILNILTITAFVAGVFATGDTGCPHDGIVTFNAHRINSNGTETPVLFTYIAGKGGHINNGLEVSCIKDTSDCPTAGEYKINMKLTDPKTGELVPVWLVAMINENGTWKPKMQVICAEVGKCDGVDLFGALQAPGVVTVPATGVKIPATLNITVDKSGNLGEHVEIIC